MYITIIINDILFSQYSYLIESNTFALFTSQRGLHVELSNNKNYNKVSLLSFCVPPQASQNNKISYKLGRNTPNIS